MRETGQFEIRDIKQISNCRAYTSVQRCVNKEILLQQYDISTQMSVKQLIKYAAVSIAPIQIIRAIFNQIHRRKIFFSSITDTCMAFVTIYYNYFVRKLQIFRYCVFL